MKKTIILLLMLIPFVAISQVTNGYVSFVADSTVDSETINLSISSPDAITRNHAVTLTIIPVNTSGTATVLGMPQGSLDNIEFFDLQAAPDTINNAGTVANKTYTYTDAYWRYYRENLISTGSGRTDYTGQLGLKRKY